MEAGLNPFSPGSGLRPPELVGRAAEIEAFDTVVARTRNRLHDRGIVLTGLRGVGKTVLLNEMYRHAQRLEWLCIRIEARREGDDGSNARRALARDLVVSARKYSGGPSTDGMQRALQSISSFNSSLGATNLSLGVDFESGRADSGDFEVDALELVEDVCSSLAHTGRAFAIFIDELQDLDKTTLGGLIAAQHLAGQQGWPFFIIGAGLPNLPRVLSDERSYAERLFTYRSIGQLTHDDASRALTDPVERLGAGFEDAALDVILKASGGYPYFVQEYGQAIWNLATEKTFSEDDARAAVALGLERLDTGFFRSRWERATPAERRFLRAMADDDDESSATASVARRLGLKPSSLGPSRAGLLSKGLVYSPEHGRIAYSVPGMARYVKRHHLDDESA